MTARTVRFVFAVLVVAGIAFVGAMASAGGSASAAQPGPPTVKWGVAAQPTCQSIVDAGYAPHDYVLWGGSWRYQPQWAGADAVRMSWLWRSAPACLVGAKVLPPAATVFQTITHDPAPTVVGSRPIIGEPEEVERGEQEVEYQASHIAGGPERDGKQSQQRTGFSHEKPCAPQGTPLNSRLHHGTQRDCWSGQQWSQQYGTEHPRGVNYDPNYDPTDKNARGYKPENDPNHDDYKPRTNRGDSHLEQNNREAGTYIPCSNSQRTCSG